MFPKSKTNSKLDKFRQKLNRLSVAAVMAYATLAGTQSVNGQQQPAGATTPQFQQNQKIETLAVVNRQPISRQQIATQSVRRFGEDVLKTIIKKQLVYSECQRLGIQITEKDINDEITSRASQFNMSAEYWINMICTRRNMTPDRLKEDFIWHEVALRRLAADEIEVTPQELQRQVEIEYGEKVQVREIVCKDMASANQALSLLTGENAQRFSSVAKDYSLNPNSAAVGGLLPPVARHVTSNKDLEQIIFSLEPGQISNAIQIAEDQVIILKCERKYPAMELSPEQLTAVHERLVTDISEEKLAAVARELSKRLQGQAKIVNVHNDPKLSVEMPGVAALVNGVRITKGYLAEQCIEQFGISVLAAEINRMILVQALQDNSMQITAEDVNNEILQAAESFGYRNNDGSINKDAWLEFATRGDLEKVDFYIEDEVWPSAALKKIVKDTVQVTQEDMQKGFEANFGPRVEALAMVFNDHRQATKVWQMAKANPTAEYFGQLANQYSVEPASQANFGEVPPIQRHGGRQQLEAEAFSLQPGEISKVVQVGEHYVVLMCRGQTTPRITQIDDVKEQLHRDIHEKKLQIAMMDKLEALTAAAQIDNFLAGTSQAGQQTRTANQNGQSAPRVPFKSRR